MQAGAQWKLPRARHPQTRRLLYVFAGQGLHIETDFVAKGHVAEVDAQHDLWLRKGPAGTECLRLQAKPIGEPVAQYGPFVMNTQAEIHQAFRSCWVQDLRTAQRARIPQSWCRRSKREPRW